jgi:hypothetical protein
MGNPLHSEPRTGGCLDWFRGCWTAGPLIWTVAAVMAPAMGWAAPFVDVTASGLSVRAPRCRPGFR